MDFKFAVSTPINVVRKRGQSDSCLSVGLQAVNDSGYFTPSPVYVEKSPTDDSQYEAVHKGGSSSLDATPLSTGRLRGLDLENDSPCEFTQLKTAFDDESHKKLSIVSRQFDRLHSNLLKSRKEHSYKTHQNRLVFLHDIGTLVGENRVDFIKELSDLNLRDVTSLILKSVDDSDLCAMCCASKPWSNAVLSDSVAKGRRKTYLESCTKEKENNLNELNAKSKVCTRRVARNLLDDIINVHSNRLEDSEKADNVDPAEAELKHYKQFVEAGQRLKPNEMLDKCPRCASPAKVNSQQKRAICSVSGCEFDYCTLCRCEYNFRHHCTPVKQRSRKLSIPSKKRSKKFLRRLLT